MFRIEQMFIARNRTNRVLKPIGMVLHETANPNSSAINNFNYFNNSDVGASAHAFIDSTRIIQTIPWNEQANHAMSPANEKFIGAEMCHYENPTLFSTIYSNTVELFAYVFVNILHIDTVTKDNLMSHNEVSIKWGRTDHTDPDSYLAKFGKSIDGFRSDVQKAMGSNNIFYSGPVNTGSTSSGNFTDKDSADKYFNHIPKYRRRIAPLYWDDGVPNTLGDIYNINKMPNLRDPFMEDYFRIGDCVLPVQSIKVNTKSESTEHVRIRQKESARTKSGYRQKEISVVMELYGISKINGMQIIGPNGYEYIDGLRPLIAQIKKSPFLPIENYLLNSMHDIHAVVIVGINVSTVPQFNDLLTVELILMEFNIQPYLGLPNEIFGDCFDWDMYRWYYNRSLLPNNDTYLEPIEDTKYDSFSIYIMNEDVLRSNKRGGLDDDSNMELFQIPKGVYIESMQVGMGNIIKNLQLSYQSIPTSQYFGCTSTMINMTLKTQNVEAVEAFTVLQNICEKYAREYRNLVDQGYISLYNQVVQLFGVKNVMLENVKISNEGELPGLYTIDIIFSSYDKAQRKNFIPDGFSPTYSNGGIEDLLSNINTKENIKRPIYYDQVVENMIKKIDLYPDLELPTYTELNEASKKIKEFRRRNGLESIDYDQLVFAPANSELHVEPDFYYCYPSLEDLGIYQAADEFDNVKAAGQRVSGMLEKMAGNQNVAINEDARSFLLTKNNVNVSTSTSFNKALDTQMALKDPPPQKQSGKRWVNANRSEVEKYMIPSTEGVNKYQFLDLSRSNGISEAQIKDFLSNKGVLAGKENVYINAAKKYNISEVYLIAHSCLETDNGRSNLATGILVNGSKVYNMYGIHAFDKNADLYGSQYAGSSASTEEDSNKVIWSSVDIAIDQGAKWISYNYIHRQGNQQNTLYKMRWSPNKPGEHQYATDISWAISQCNNMKSMFDEFPSAQVKFDITEWEGSTNNTPKTVGPTSPLKDVTIKNLNITSPYGSRVSPTTGASTNHRGIDLGANTGDIVVSVCDGTVKLINDTTESAFNVFITDDVNKQTFTYMHIDNVIVTVGQKVTKGQAIASIASAPGNPRNTLSTGSHLHFQVELDDILTNPTQWLGKSDTSINALTPNAAKSNIESKTNKSFTFSGERVEDLGNPLITNIGTPSKAEDLLDNTTDNIKDSLLSRMTVDMYEYNKRGTMMRAFPTYLLLFVDEGMWMDGHRLWSNFYCYHSVVDISVERNRKKPADTAIVRMNNLYNSLSTNPKVFYGEDSWYRTMLKSMQWYDEEIKQEIVDKKNSLLSAFNVRPGCRLHIRMGYGNDIDKLPISFNGTIAEVDTGDIVTVLAQGDGYELTLNPVGVNEDEATNMTNIGTTPHAIITYLMAARSSEVMNKISGGTYGETSLYGAEHFGNLFVRGKNANLWDKYKEDKLKGLDWFGVATSTAAKAVAYTLLSAIAPDEWTKDFFYEDYDIAKNIYNANYEISKIFEGPINSEAMWFEESADKGTVNKTEAGKENTISMWTYNKTIWDIFQTLAGIMPDFICQPHHHQFRSTLFYGMPIWNVKYKYDYNMITNGIKEYSKPFSQLHIIDSVFDIIDNSIRVVSPEVTAVIGTYTDTSGNNKSIMPVYADRSIKNEFIKTSIVDSGLKWTYTGSAAVDYVLDKTYVSWIVDKFGGGVKDGGCRNMAISALQESFRDMYQGSLLVMGDASIKPYDVLYISDNYVGIDGHVEVGSVVYHMGIETGFVTVIEADLCTESVNADLVKWKVYQGLSAIAISTMLYVSKFHVYAHAKSLSKFVQFGTKISNVGTWIKETRLAQSALSNAKVISGIEKATLGVNKIKQIYTGAKLIKNTMSTVRLAIFTAGAATGAGIVFALAALLVMEILEAIFDSAILYLENWNTIKIYPLWYREKPFVAGINGHKNLIPGCRDEWIYLNYKNQDGGTIDATNSLKNLTESHKLEINEFLLEEARLLNEDTLIKTMIALVEAGHTLFINDFPKYIDPKDKTIKRATDRWTKNKKFNGMINKSTLYQKGIQTEYKQSEGLYRPVPKDWVMVYNNDVKKPETKFRSPDAKLSPSTWTAQPTPVCSIADGTVIYTGIYKTLVAQMSNEGFMESIANKGEEWFKGWKDEIQDNTSKNVTNSVIIIEHTNNVLGNQNKIRSLYINVVCPCVIRGDVVTAGEVIGTIGGVWFAGITNTSLNSPLMVPVRGIKAIGDGISNVILPPLIEGYQPAGTDSNSTEVRSNRLAATGNELVFIVVGTGNDKNVYDPRTLFPMTQEDEYATLGNTYKTITNEIRRENVNVKLTPRDIEIRKNWAAYKKEIDSYNRDNMSAKWKRELQLKYGLGITGISAEEVEKIWKETGKDIADLYESTIKNELERGK